MIGERVFSSVMSILRKTRPFFLYFFDCVVYIISIAIRSTVRFVFRNKSKLLTSSESGKEMEAERQAIIQALKKGKGNDLLNQKIFRIAKNKMMANQARREAEEGYEKSRRVKHGGKLHAEIWRDFSASISNAPHNSEEQALGFAGRSLLFHHMTKYEECLRDIERALKITKDNNVRVELFARKALCHAELGQPEKNVAVEKAEFYLKKVGMMDKEKPRLKMFVARVRKDVDKIEPKEPETKRAKVIEMLKQKDSENPFTSVDIRYDTRYGRHLVAKKDFKAGEIICAQKPYSLSTNTDFLPFAYCCHCMCISWDSVPCISCGWALFCSEKCRDEAYQQYHDVECDVMPRVRDMEVPDIFKQLTIRTLVMAVKECGGLAQLKEELKKVDSCSDQRTKGFSDDGKFDGSKFRSIYSLAHSVSAEMLSSHIDESIKVLFAFINCSSLFGQRKYKTIEQLINDEDMMYVGSLILRLIKIFNISYQGFFEDNILCENGNIPEICAQVHCCYRGMMITPLFGLLNHSCTPNSMITFTDARNVVLLALRPIKKNEQIFKSYGYEFYFTERSKRQIMLAKHYNFICDCKACLENWPIDKDMDQEKEISLPNVSKKQKIGPKTLDDIKDLVHETVHKETHSLEQIQKLGKTFSRVIKNYAEPSYLICALMNAIERVSHNIYLTKLIDQLNNHK